MQYEVKIDGLAELQAALKRVGGEAGPLIRKQAVASALEIQRLAREKAPHKTGTLQRSIQAEPFGVGAIVKVNEKYGVYIEEGTGPFDIRPRNKKALFWPGADHPVRVVHHPGIKARPFFRPAIHEALPFIQRQLKVAGDTMVRAIAERSRA